MIITHLKKQSGAYNNKGLTPDMFVSEKVKNSKDYIAATADYFSNKALQGYRINANTFARNYAFVKGELNAQDFYENDVTRDFIMDLVDEDNPLPDYVQQYSILNQPLNTMCGEFSGRPDNTMVKAFDDDSRSEELAFKTDILQQYILGKAQERIQLKLVEQGIDIETEEGQSMVGQMTEEEIGDLLTSYTSTAEKWGSRMLEALKLDFNLKEVIEDSFRDLLITGKPRFHIFKDRSKLGFSVESLNPKNVVVFKSPNKKYTRDAYTVSIIDVLTISEIIERYPLTKKEVDHLRERSEHHYANKSMESNLFNNKTGLNSITYNTYYEGEREDALLAESALMQGEQLDDLSTNVIGDSYIVCNTYTLSKIKVGKLTYIDEDGITQSILVGEDYKEGEHPQEVELEWGYENQWWQYVKIGDDVYLAEPYDLLPYCPIIGVDFENRNAPVKSLIDLMKPWQVIFNVCMNQLWELLQKEQGVTVEFNWRKIPVNKDSDYDDALDEWLTQARELGFIFKDDSPENMQAPNNNTDVTKVLDLGRGQEMQSRLNIAMQVKSECHQLVGITPERLGGVAATQTATGTQASLSQSFSQTEPWCASMEYVVNQLFQGILDAAQYIESQKDTSTVTYVSNEGEHAFIQMQGPDLKLKDLRVYVTSRSEDQRVFQQLQSLAQPMLQNGADFATVAKMFDTKSLRALHDTFKEEKRKREQQQQQEMEMRQQEIQSSQEIAQAQMQQLAQEKEGDRIFEARENELNRLSKERIALLSAAGRDTSVLDDADNSGVADALEVSKMDAEKRAANQQYELAQQKIQSDVALQQQKLAQNKEDKKQENKRIQEELALKKEDLRIKEKKIDTDLKVAKENQTEAEIKSKGRNTVK